MRLWKPQEKLSCCPFNHKLLPGSWFSWWAGVWQGAQTCLFPLAGAKTSCWTFTYPLPSPTITLPGLWNCPLFSCAEGNGTPLQDSCLENSMDGGAWWATVHGVAESQTWLGDFTFFISIIPMGLKKHKLESRLQGKISITSNMQMTPPLGRKWRGTKKPLDEVKEESEKLA